MTVYKSTNSIEENKIEGMMIHCLRGALGSKVQVAGQQCPVIAPITFQFCP